MTEKEKLPGDYIAGFVDGEGCFALKYRTDQKRRKDGTFRTYNYWSLEFAIVLRPDDAKILYAIKDTLNCGSVTLKKAGDQVRYSIQDPRTLRDIVVPFFEQNQLRAKKKYDFDHWKKAVRIIAKIRNHEINSSKQGFIALPISREDHEVLRGIREQMLEYKSKRTKGFLHH